MFRLTFSSFMATCVILTSWSQQSSAAETATSTTNTPRDTRRNSGEIFWSPGAEPVSLDPTKQVDGSSASWLGHMFEGLLMYDATGKLVPASAESYQISPDHRVYTFTIRPTARWHDGKPVTAHDFAYTFRRLVDPAYASVYSFIATTAGILNASDVIARKLPVDKLGVKALDDRHFEVTLAQPVAFFPSLMAFQSFYPVRQDLVEKFGEQFAVEPASVIGNGPFRLAKWQKDHSLRIERVATHWNANQIRITALESPAVIKDAQADYNNFITGGIDVLTTKVAEVVRQAQDAKLKMQTYDTGCVSFLSLNQKPGRPFANRELRQAIQKGINRTEFVNKIVGVPGNKPIYTFVPDFMPGSKSGSFYRKEVPIVWKDHDLAAAKQHLQAFLDQTHSLRAPPFTILSGDSSREKKYAEYWQNELAKLLGTEVRVDNAPLKVMVQKERDKDYDLSLTGWCPDYMDAMTFMDFHTGTNDNNFTGWSNPAHDKLIEEAGREANLAKRVALFAAAEKIYLNEAPSVPYYQSGGIVITAEGLTGVKKNVVGVGNDFRFARWATNKTTHH